MNQVAEAEAPEPVSLVRQLADQAFSRAAGALLIPGNSVHLLKDAQENYPAWLQAIASARRTIHFENYIIREDDTGRMFADALIAKAREGVRVQLIYDWMGNFGKTSRKFWNHLREGGIEVRCYNPPRLDSPLGWLSRDHRKMLAVDTQVAYVTGLCVGREWVGEPEKNLEDLTNATEVVLDAKHRVRAPGAPTRARGAISSGTGSAGRAAAGVFRIGNSVGAAMSDRRVLEPVEMRIMTAAGLLLLSLAVLFALFPRLLAYPLIAIIVWLAVALLYRGYKLKRERGRGIPHPAQITLQQAAEDADEIEPKKE